MKTIKELFLENISDELYIKFFKYREKMPTKYIPDKLYLKWQFKKIMGKPLNLTPPKTFNEKLQWLKLYDRNPLYTQMVDKYEVRKYVSKIIGDEYLIPLLGVWDNFEEIEFDMLPKQFVLKTTHDSGGIVICKDKNDFDIKAAKRKIKRSLIRNYYKQWREWPYKNVKPKVVAEKYMVDESMYELKDYKMFCFNGTPKMIQVDYNRYTSHKKNLYDTDWNYMPISYNYPTDSNISIKKPVRLNDMLDLATTLSKDIPYIRVDFYSIDDKLYFGELTFFPATGMGKFSPEEWDYTFGSWINLDAAYSRRR